MARRGRGVLTWLPGLSRWKRVSGQWGITGQKHRVQIRAEALQSERGQCWGTWLDGLRAWTPASGGSREWSWAAKSYGRGYWPLRMRGLYSPNRLGINFQPAFSVLLGQFSLGLGSCESSRKQKTGALGKGCEKCPQVPRAWEELRLPSPMGDGEGGTLEEQSLLCPLVSHRLKPNQTTAQASSASNQSCCTSQTPPSFLRLPTPVPLPSGPQESRPQDSSSPRTQDLQSILLRTQKFRSPAPLEPEIPASGWCWASPSGAQCGSGL